MKRTAKAVIEEVLRQNPEGLAVHQFQNTGYSQNNIATRLSEMARSGVVVGENRDGNKFNTWKIADPKTTDCAGCLLDGRGHKEFPEPRA